MKKQLIECLIDILEFFIIAVGGGRACIYYSGLFTTYGAEYASITLAITYCGALVFIGLKKYSKKS